MLCLCIAHWLNDGKAKKLAFLFIITVAIVIKCLNGYEYITTVTLLACAGYVFSLIGGTSPIRLSNFILIFIACMVDFFIAVSLYAIQLHHVNSEYGIQNILARAGTLTGANGGKLFSELFIERLKAMEGNDLLISIFQTSLNDNKILFAYTVFKEYFFKPD